MPRPLLPVAAWPCIVDAKVVKMWWRARRLMILGSHEDAPDADADSLRQRTPGSLRVLGESFKRMMDGREKVKKAQMCSQAAERQTWSALRATWSGRPSHETLKPQVDIVRARRRTFDLRRKRTPLRRLFVLALMDVFER